MGLAASQARLLLLTARKSDLEYRAQQITNSLMILAQQTETVAREYSVKISNQTIIYQGADKDQTVTKVSASTLSDIGGDAYTLKVYDESQDRYVEWQPKYKDGYVRDDGKVITEEQYEQLTPEQQAAYTHKQNAIISNDYNGPELLEAYNNGSIIIVDRNGQEVDLNSNVGFVTTYYTDDDKQAEAEYNTKTASIQVKEKRLQNDLNQIETQQSACDTEIDSVKKILDKNIERTFKVFS